MIIKISTPAAFKFLKIMKKLNINLSDIASNFKKKEKVTDENIEEKQEELGFEMFELLINGLEKVEDEVNEFLMLILRIDRKTFDDTDLITDIMPAIVEYEGWKRFLEIVSKLQNSVK